MSFRYLSDEPAFQPTTFYPQNVVVAPKPTVTKAVTPVAVAQPQVAQIKPQAVKTLRALTDNEIKERTDPANPLCPFNDFVGNEKSVRRLMRSAAAALKRPDRSCSDLAYAIIGPASTGKTTVVKKFSQCVELPFADIHPMSVKNIQEFLAEVREKLAASGVVSEPIGNKILLPCCVIFVDEVHSLSNNIVQALLKATEAKDRVFDTGDFIVDCTNVCWVIATTDRGLLFDAFDTRFTKIVLSLYSKAQIAEIVGRNFPKWDKETCQIVAKFGGSVPREVLSFGKEMQLEAARSGSSNWFDIAKIIAEDNDIDEHGMPLRHVTILKALNERGSIPKQRMCEVAGVKAEELDRFIMPQLLSDLPDRPALVTTTTKGYGLTPTGIEELKLRQIIAAEVSTE